ncbi:E3 ubiquitin-protein ligase TRIM65-like isoform X2 [Macrobrachium nipponense]
METELTCAVCSDIYLEGRREPVTLPVCGHTFCRQCLLSIERTDNFSCPYCRTKHPGPPVAQIATVYAILNLTKYLRRSKFGLCDSHNSTLDFWCQTCHTGLCGFCFFESPCKNNHNVLVMKNALDEKKVDIGKAGSRFLESIDAEKALAMRKIHGYFEAVADQCSNAESLNAQAKTVKELMADAENTLSMECAISVHEKMQEYLPSVRKSLEMTSDEVPSSCSQASSSALPSPLADNTKAGSRHAVYQILMDDSKTDDDQMFLQALEPLEASLLDAQDSLTNIQTSPTFTRELC